MKKANFLTRTIVLVSFVSLFTDISSEMLYPVMPVFLKSIGFSVILIGILEGIAEATAGISKGYFGNLSDAMGKRVPFVRFGYLLSAISKPMMVLFTHPLWIFFARTSDRLGKGIRTSARDAMLSDESSQENKGKVFGFHRGMDTLGAAIGPALALLYLWYYPENYKPLFLFAIIPGLIAVSITFLLKDRNSQYRKNKSNPGFFDFLKYWKKSPKEYRTLVSGLLAFTFFNSSDVFLLLMLKQHDLSDTAMIGFYIFYNLIYALFSYPAGMLADKIGLKRVLFIGLSLFVLVYLFMPQVNSYTGFGLLFFAYGIYASATEGIYKALITNISHKSETATAIGFFNSFASIMTMLASTVAGFLWEKVNPAFTFYFAGFGVLLVLIYLSVLFTRKEKTKV